MPSRSWFATVLLTGVALAAAAAVPAAELVDDAGRSVALPERAQRVFAAGAPAEILLYTLVPEMLVGRNHQPSPAALELMPPEYRALTPIVNLPDRDDARYDAELIALRPDVYVDYGTVDADYVVALEAITARTGVPGLILSGRLSNVPDVYRRLGVALGVATRGDELAAVTQGILDRYRGALAAQRTRVYAVCGGDGLVPCLEDHSAGEALAWLGAVNVAGTLATAPRRPWTIDEIRATAPAVIVTTDAARLRADPEWQSMPAVAAGRVHAPPALPFGWGPRPPSVNRLLGLVWLAYVVPGRAFDDAFFADIGALFAALYHIEPTREQLSRLVATD